MTRRVPTFGEELRDRRKTLGLTGLDVQLLTGISRSMLCEVEGGARVLRPKHWPVLARALKLPVKVLARWAGACEACGGTGIGPHASCETEKRSRAKV
jgi:transcriptional regulator with XRE-family HTH domain